MNQSTVNSMTSNKALTYCFFGAGSQAEAIVRGMLKQSITAPSQIQMINRSNQERLAELRQRYEIQADNDIDTKRRWLSEADIIILAMKPKDVREACHELRSLLRKDCLVVSVIAGLSIESLQRMLGTIAVVRTMPNTSSTIGLGATGVSYSSEVTAEQREIAINLLQAIGIVAEVEEVSIDAITGVSGSGPAYVYYLMEAMIEAGIQEGLEPEQAHDLVVQTVRGAAEMVRLTGESPAELRRKVCSPGGATLAALTIMDQNGVGEAVKSAVHRARTRAAEMGEEIGREIH
ncbi:pyrroline-5-carboxylate reductase [Paenibacillus agilis]|uniref:Pyrroline-5-carboxylate reductase n=1 Tax=Paenibacillus agilis TaxID=3020863 RepID=A0A559IZ93_9BACL|nr:pyrroline-5-carboxylate reductase [Paenibacillus agilis]TVX92941.1 pyrroline-5-carboxylate reductase [Paenibacillus agilis]